MKYRMNARVFAWAFTKLLRDYYRQKEDKKDIGVLCKAVRKEFRAMVERTPGIGGSSNESNLIGACYFFAMARVIPDMTPEKMDDIIKTSMESDFMVRLHQGKKKKGTLFSEKMQQKKLQEAEKSQTSDYEMDWKFTYQPGKGEFYLTYTRCGICRLAEREHMEAYLPCMCKMDYPKFKIMGGRLLRDQTLAAGDSCCNFHVVKE